MTLVPKIKDQQVSDEVSEEALVVLQEDDAPSASDLSLEFSAPPEGSRKGVDFKKLGDKMRHEREHGPELDAAWNAGRLDGSIPTFPRETHDAILTGNTFAAKDQIKRMLGKWDGGRKAWVVPAMGRDYCDRVNYDYVQKLQKRLDDLATIGIVITYVESSGRP